MLKLASLKLFQYISITILTLSSCNLLAFTQDIEIGPQIYNLERTKEGGTKQNGALYGGRISYERLKDFGFYFGAFLDAAWGPINGHTGSGTGLSSNFTDLEIQGLVGYTINCNNRFKAQLTPFVGVGYLQQTNKITEPLIFKSLQFQDRIEYYSFGFLTTSYLNDLWSIGLRMTVKFMYDANCYITDDPDPTIEDMTQVIENKMLFALDLPITYKLFANCSRYKITLMPFFQTRHLGGRMNYPMDFLDTRYKAYGARLLFDIMF